MGEIFSRCDSGDVGQDPEGTETLRTLPAGMSTPRAVPASGWLGMQPHTKWPVDSKQEETFFFLVITCLARI